MLGTAGHQSVYFQGYEQHSQHPVAITYLWLKNLDRTKNKGRTRLGPDWCHVVNWFSISCCLSWGDLCITITWFKSLQNKEVFTKIYLKVFHKSDLIQNKGKQFILKNWFTFWCNTALLVHYIIKTLVLTLDYLTDFQ